MQKKLISIVTPAYNEAENLPILATEIKAVMEPLLHTYDYELIMVSDGSTDGTWQVIKDLADTNSRIKGIMLSRNFGHQLAITAGLEHAKGDVIIYCDADLQHPPSLFPEMIKKWEEGYQVVHTRRTSTVKEPILKKVFSLLFYEFIAFLSGLSIEKGMADFKLLDRQVLDQLIAMREHNRFLRGMVPWLGYESHIINFEARERLHGKPWYTFRRNLSFAKQGILSFSLKPLKYIGYLGVLLMTVSSLIVIIGLIRLVIKGSWFLSPIFSLLLINTFLIGLVLASLGIIALYISYIYTEVKMRPLYIISGKVNL